MRYCEVWYQGRGLEVSSRKPFRDLPLDGESGVLGNVVLLGRAVREETASLAHDVAAFVADPWGFQWNRARRLEGFVEGKRGGIYQIYLPGFSAFLFPAYFVDRHVLALRPTQEGEFPAELVMTNDLRLVSCAAVGHAHGGGRWRGNRGPHLAPSQVLALVNVSRPPGDPQDVLAALTPGFCCRRRVRPRWRSRIG
jgi:hypothetical protein